MNLIKIINKIPTQIKICGITSLDAVNKCASLQVSMIGLVFYQPSPRFFNINTQGAFINSFNQIRPNVKTVGLFVNPKLQEIESVLTKIPLDFIQLHGNETLYEVKNIKKTAGLPLIKGVRPECKEVLLSYNDYAEFCELILLDTPHTQEWGGSGNLFPYSWLKDIELPFTWGLAGGLTPDNVQQTLKVTNASFVDVSSGVECEKGVKDLKKIEEFVKNVRAYDTSISQTT